MLKTNAIKDQGQNFKRGGFSICGSMLRLKTSKCTARLTHPQKGGKNPAFAGEAFSIDKLTYSHIILM